MHVETTIYQIAEHRPVFQVTRTAIDFMGDDPTGFAGLQRLKHSGEYRAAWLGHFGEAIMDVREALRISEGDNRRANDDALGDLSQCILPELLLKLGLPDQHDLDELFCGDFQVREQSELFEVICVTPAMRPNWRSSGVATDEAIVSGLAPGSPAETEMVGNSTCGSGATGRFM